MAFMVDPSKHNPSNNKQNYNNTKFEKEPYAGEGKKVLQCVGTYKTRSAKGTAYYRCKFVVLNDLEGRGDEASVVWKNFFLSERAISFLLSFTQSIGHNAPFDADREEVFDGIAKSRPFVAVLDSGGEYGPEIRKFFRVKTSEVPNGCDEIIENSTIKFEDWASWKRSGGTSRASLPTSNQNQSRNNNDYGDIPF